MYLAKILLRVMIPQINPVKRKDIPMRINTLINGI